MLIAAYRAVQALNQLFGHSMRTFRHIIILFAAALMVAVMIYGCKEKYLPEIKDNNVNYLVVEGLINIGTDSTIFTLSRTFKLNNNPIEAPEKGAIVQVESDAGVTYVLPELIKAGRYGRPPLGADPTKKCRLRIRTMDNREYLSDFVESETSPPFDLNFDIKNDALNFYISTHDPAGKSIYYQHSYVETWEYHSPIRSIYKIENGSDAVVLRKFPEDDITTCWRILPSSNIVLSSTANLLGGHLAGKLITSVSGTSPKLAVEYSILVKQIVLTPDGFKFFETLRNNTENIGSIFDAQPSQMFFGNVRSTTDPAETVIGFVSAGTVFEKRLLIQVSDLPVEWLKVSLDLECEESINPISALRVNKRFIPIDALRGTELLRCVDCRLQGGSTQRPSYWK